MRLPIAILIPLHLFGQADQCSTAPPYPDILPACRVFAPTDTATVCYAFAAPTQDILLDAITTSSCATVTREFTLFDGLSCDTIATNSSGYFPVTPGQDYVVCVRLVCIGGNGIQGVCVVDPLPLFATLVAISGGVEMGQIYVKWVSVDIDNTHYRVMRSMDMVTWEEVGWRDAYGQPGEPTAYMWAGDGRNGDNYLRLYDGHDVLLGQVAVPFRSIHRDVRFNIIGQRIR